MTASFAQDSATAQTWTYFFNMKSIEEKSVGDWYARGAHYLLVDEKNTGMDRRDFDVRIQHLTEQGATLLYQSQGVSNLVPRQAILWSFKAQHPLDLTFDDHLRLVGYDISRSEQGDYHLVLYWYTAKPGASAYNLFAHVFDPNSGVLLGQADSPLGQGNHPSSTWRQGEIVFDPVTVPASALSELTAPYRIRIGLYQLSSGARAQIIDDSQKPLGDSFELLLP